MTSGALAGHIGTSRQFGFERLSIQVDGHQGYLLKPADFMLNRSNPWVWYAPHFSGDGPPWPPSIHEWTFVRVLQAGIAVCGVDVGESWGSPTGRRGFTLFHRAMVKGFGLNPRARLLGQSRGALYHYNWAADHPECVDRLAQIYPVCDLSRAPVSFDRLAEAYGMSAAGLQEQLSAHNPIERLAPLVAAGIPIFHVHGDADAVVPLAQHSTELARRYQALGGEIELLVVHGQGHEEVDAFFKCQALVDFLTRE